MNETVQNPQPSLIVVAGRPGSGKTTLTHSLARAVRCPAICRDEVKEGLVNTTGITVNAGNDITRQAYEAFFDTIQLLLRHGITIAAEAAFQHPVWEPKLEPIREIARVRIVLCAIDPALARARHIERSFADPDRERFHPDRVVQAAREGHELPIDDYDPPHLNVPTLTVDTSDGYQPAFETIVSFACA